MKNKRHSIVFVLFISMLIIFSIFTISLVSQYPHKVRGIYFYLDHGDNELDHLDISEVQASLNNNGYSIRSISDLPYQFSGEGLEIIPLNNPDVVIFLINDNNVDIYFYGWVESEVRFPGGYGDLGKADDELKNEMENILGYVGSDVSKDDLRFGDNDFDIMFEVFNSIIFFFLLSVNIILAFIILYKKGLLIDKISENLFSEPKTKGVILLFIGLFPFLFMLNEVLNSINLSSTPSTICTGFCLVISFVLILLGLFMLFPIKKTIRQNQD